MVPIQAWEKRGIEGVTLLKRSAFATADIYVPREVWSANDRSTIRNYLASTVKSAVAGIAQCAELRGVHLLGSALERDVDEVAQKFVAPE
jgi:hypothetical protein